MAAAFRRKSHQKLTLELAAYLDFRGESQVHLAERYNNSKKNVRPISQPHLSKLLSGKVIRRSRFLDDLCIFCGINLFETVVENPAGRDMLEACLAEVWDGSEQHAKQLARLLRQVSTMTTRSETTGG